MAHEGIILLMAPTAIHLFFFATEKKIGYLAEKDVPLRLHLPKLYKY